MRIFILANDDLTSNIIFSRLVDHPEIEVVGLAFAASPMKGGRSTVTGAIRLLSKVDWRYWTFLIFSNGLFKLFEAITRLGQLNPRSGRIVSLRAACRRANIPVITVRDFNSPDFASYISNANVELMVIRIGTILRSNILSLPIRGTWCAHSSLLPGFRGIAGEFHALRFAGSPIGSSVFVVTSQLDMGPILRRVEIVRREDRSVFDHIIRNNWAAADMLLSAILELDRNGGIEPAPALAVPSSYFSWPTSSDMHAFKGQGKRLISMAEMTRFALACCRLIRVPFSSPD